MRVLLNYLLVGNYKKELDDVKYRPRIKIPEDIRDKKIIQVEIDTNRYMVECLRQTLLIK